MKKNYLLNIILTILVISIMSIIYITTFIKKEKDISNNQNIVNLYITGINNEIIFNDDVTYYEGESLLDVLNRYVSIEMGNGNYSGMILSINNVKTDISNSYFKLVVNCEFLTTGANDYLLKPNDQVRITYSSIEDFNVGC